MFPEGGTTLRIPGSVNVEAKRLQVTTGRLDQAASLTQAGPDNSDLFRLRNAKELKELQISEVSRGKSILQQRLAHLGFSSTSAPTAYPHPRGLREASLVSFPSLPFPCRPGRLRRPCPIKAGEGKAAAGDSAAAARPYRA